MTWMEQIQQLAGRLCPENVAHHHCLEERASLFQTFEGGGTEIETLWLLWALVRITKPGLVLETGTFHGVGTVALASAVKDNGGGKVLSVELDTEKAAQASELIKRAGLAEHVEIFNRDSLEFIKSLDTEKYRFGFAFFDSTNAIRPIEFKMLYEKGGLTNLIAFHDTSRLREKTFKIEGEPQDVYVAELDKIEQTYCRGALEFPLAKGLRVMQLDKNINPAFYWVKNVQ